MTVQQDRSPVRTRLLAAGGALLVGIAGASAQDANVRVFHASPDTPEVIINVNEGAAQVGPLAFGNTTGYIPLAPGDYRFQVAAAAAPMDFVIDIAPTLEAGVDYSVFAINTLANIEPLVLVDDNTSVAGQARFRVLHLNTDAPTVDLNVRGGPTLATLSFTDVSDYLSVAPGTYDLDLNLAGTDTTALALDGITLLDGYVYTVVAFGGVNEPLSVGLFVDAIPAPGSMALLAVAGVFASRRRR
ncbi:MAG: DUF4397 domain-containing protein [Phycisphaerales bacterium]|nr:MAG: DUF4397 domain-containing protein [Phycisphaerales bacterium]